MLTLVKGELFSTEGDVGVATKMRVEGRQVYSMKALNNLIKTCKGLSPPLLSRTSLTMKGALMEERQKRGRQGNGRLKKRRETHAKYKSKRSM